MKRRLKKVADYRQHFAERMAERYGVTITRADYDDLCAQIRNGRATFCFAESNTRTHFVVIMSGHAVPVIYDKSRSAIVTALPSNARLPNGSPYLAATHPAGSTNPAI